MNLRLTSVKVARGSDGLKNQQAFHEGFLATVPVRLSDAQEANAGRWFMEVGFGRIDQVRPPTIADLDEARAWIADRPT